MVTCDSSKTLLRMFLESSRLFLDLLVQQCPTTAESGKVYGSDAV